MWLVHGIEIKQLSRGSRRGRTLRVQAPTSLRYSTLVEISAVFGALRDHEYTVLTTSVARLLDTVLSHGMTDMNHCGHCLYIASLTCQRNVRGRSHVGWTTESADYSKVSNLKLYLSRPRLLSSHLL